MTAPLPKGSMSASSARDAAERWKDRLALGHSEWLEGEVEGMGRGAMGRRSALEVARDRAHCKALRDSALVAIRVLIPKKARYRMGTRRRAQSRGRSSGSRPDKQVRAQGAALHWSRVGPEHSTSIHFRS